jgi:hypothetical protein
MKKYGFAFSVAVVILVGYEYTHWGTIWTDESGPSSQTESPAFLWYRQLPTTRIAVRTHEAGRSFVRLSLPREYPAKPSSFASSQRTLLPATKSR